MIVCLDFPSATSRLQVCFALSKCVCTQHRRLFAFGWPRQSERWNWSCQEINPWYIGVHVWCIQNRTRLRDRNCHAAIHWNYGRYEYVGCTCLAGISEYFTVTKETSQLPSRTWTHWSAFISQQTLVSLLWPLALLSLDHFYAIFCFRLSLRPTTIVIILKKMRADSNKRRRR